MAKLDASGDGVVSAEEFLAWWSLGWQKGHGQWVTPLASSSAGSLAPC